MAQDATALYMKDKVVPAKQLANNYNPEFLKIVRDAQREAIKVFGFNIREMGEKKGLAFKTAKFKALLNYHIDTKDIDEVDEEEPINSSALERVNAEFALAAALFVANTSEEQLAYITATNEKDIQDAEVTALILFLHQTTTLTNQIGALEEQIRKIDFDTMFGASKPIGDAKKEKLRRKIEERQQALDKLNKSKDALVGKEIERQIIAKGNTRSPLIASQNVGMATAFSRSKEVELVTQNVPTAKKIEIWRAILDSKTREDHAAADGQRKEAGFYIVGGHRCKYPMDATLPMEQSANCRCVEEIRVEFV